MIKAEALLTLASIINIPQLLNAFFPIIKAVPDGESADHEVVRKSRAHSKDPREGHNP